MEAYRNEQVVFRECQQGFEEEINKPPVPYNIIITKMSENVFMLSYWM